ncbi:sugar transporter SWEET1-like isoform X1 [Schistocerca nitens]|uniref:sugar transporter SWEET1-like isoform X1 n=1 Tax=Schistocerca nitens TaxID=7011 RepID=UPI002117C947|nr:sugar transporter SWEET1-like isoform X1 [Schistocerca nitens]
MTPELENKFIHPCFWDNWLRYRTGVYYTPICKGFIDTGTTGESEPTTFVAALLSSSLWLLYGIAISDTSTIIVNSIGALLQSSYVVTYYIYAIRKSQVLKYMAAFIVVLLLTLLYLYFDTNPDRKRYHMGLICTFVTIMFFAAPLVTLRKVIRSRSTRSLPFPIILMTFLSSVQWLIYGFLLGDPFMKIVNVIGTLLSTFQLSLFVIYRDQPVQAE